MIARLTIAATLLAAAAPALAADNQPAPEQRIRNIASLLETVPDPRQGVFIRAYDGRWYYARTLDECPRLTATAPLRLIASPGGYFDRNSAVVADGWRCLVSSVVASDGPPSRRN
ncbi:MAG TPA: hypothetical protein VMG08_10175 [Allosphingosinicella sp.]|nr:hypothetical protein [Allosphingosinicella sp.]